MLINYILLALVFLLVATLYLRKKKTHTSDVTTSGKQIFDFNRLHYTSPEWVRDAVLYQLNIRQFTPEGNFESILPHIPKIKALGIDIVWLMPIFPIAEKEKKCDEGETNPENCWGSPYAAADFETIHPKYGNAQDLKNLIAAIHANDMKVILDFIPNHTGFDSKWMHEHPEWFVQKNGVVQPVTSNEGEVWADIAQLDLTNTEMREAWMRVHEYWVRDFDFDGIREDCSWAIPTDYWAELRVRLDKIKPVFMLGEDEIHGKEQFPVCFECNYGWGTHHFIKQIAKGKSATLLNMHTEDIKNRLGRLGWQMNFTQNHDENTWHGSEKDLFGDGADCFTTLCFAIEGMPLIYNGQEVSLTKRLSFFGKDEIDWTGTSRRDWFKSLCDLKHNNQALWNGLYGGELVGINNTDNDKVYSFRRAKGDSQVVCIFNLSNTPTKINLIGESFAGNYMEYFSKTAQMVDSKCNFDLAAYDYKVFVKK